MLSKQRKLGFASAILIAVMVCMLVFNVVLNLGRYTDMGVTLDNTLSQQATSGSFVKSGIDMTELRNQYIDQTIVQSDIASFDGARWCIVELEGEGLYSVYKNSSRYATFKDFMASAEGTRLSANIKNAQSAVLNKIANRGITYDYKYSYSTINNGIALKLDADAVNAVKKINGVKDVYYSEEYAVPQVEVVENNAHVYTTGIYDSSALEDVDGESYRGEGMVVAILDTGLDYTHPAFNTPLESKENIWTKETVEQKLNEIRSGGADFYAIGDADQLYHSEKVPFMYDYADDDPDVFPSYSSHGTHVAGIVAGQDDDKIIDDKGDQDPTNDETFVGVAPQAQLAIFKVFTDNLESEILGGANSIDILRALNDCVALGVDVINMSLGTSCGFADGKSNGFLNSIYESIREAGISLVCAASNDYSSGFGGGNGTNLASNPDSATVGSPSTYAAALSVASINGQKSQYIQATFNKNATDNPIAFILNASDQYGKEIKFVDKLYEIAEKQPGETMTFKYVVISGDGENANYNGTVKRELASNKYRGQDVDGTIAFIKRGKTTFAEKISAAQDAGATAAIVYNNVSGTIRMSLGELTNPIPACSINMDAANAILERTTGITGLIEINSSMLAGPFMSDFSSWGPTPDLQIKPEITAHGGEITSAVASGNLGSEEGKGGHAYDIYSGTSMASPNMAGAVALLRQYFSEKYNLEDVALNDRVYQVLMSTATIANNEEGNPYSPRKQGAGLADIGHAVNAEAYLTVGDDIENPDSRTKCELGDDPDRKGEYVINFNLVNLSDVAQTYKPLTYVMTETLASDNKTVAEKAFMFAPSKDSVKYADITYTVGEEPVNGNITVGANQKISITATVQLTQAAKDYMVKSGFVNGMYVEGFVQLDNVSTNGVTLNLPYLAFYGDWNDAPLFDYDIYEISESEQNEEDIYKQLKSTAAATQIVGMYYNDEMVLPMGQYIYAQDENDVQVYPSRDKISVSRYDDRSQRTIYEIYAVWAGLLRNAAYMDIVIENAVTGEIVYDFTRENIGKSYAAGGGNVGAPITLDLNPGEWGMNNNETYNVRVTGQLDYQNGTDPKASNPAKNSFEFTFAVDYEAPKLVDYKIRYQPIEVNNRITYRIWMDLDIYDNQYIMDIIPAYIEKDPSTWDGSYATDDNGNEIEGEKNILNSLRLMTEYPVPVTSAQKGTTTTMSIEITDYYEEYVKQGLMYVQVEDYALNSEVYQIILDQENLNMSNEKIEFLNSDKRLTLRMGDIAYNDPQKKTGPYNMYNLTIAPNEVYTLNCPAAIDSMDKFAWRTKNGGSLVDCVKAKGNEIFGVKSTNGSALTIYLTDGTDKDGNATNEYTYAAIRVTVKGDPLAVPRPNTISLRPITNGDGNIVPASGTVELNCNMEIPLNYELTPWYTTVSGVEYKSDNEEIASVEKGVLKTYARPGTANITVSGIGYNRLSASFKVVVGSPFYVNNYTLYDCYLKGDVVVPDDLNIMYLSEYCFRNNPDITSVELPTTLTEIPRGAFMGSENLKKVTIKGQCIVIGMYAFRDCPQLEEIELGDYIDSKQEPQNAAGSIAIGQYAFENCPKLATIDNWERVTTIYDMAFVRCTSLRSVDLRALRVAGNSIFFGCTNLNEVKTSPHTQLGSYMFDGCTSLQTITISGGNLPDGLFIDCIGLKTVDLSSNTTCNSIGTEAFKGSGIQNFKLPNCRVAIGADAFANCESLTTLTLAQKTELNFDDSIVTALIDFIHAEDENGNSIVDQFVAANEVLRVNPFLGSENFKQYVIEGSSDFYKVTNGVLYTLDEETVISVPYGITGYTLPSTVKKIGPVALAGLRAGNSRLTMDLSGITEIGKFAFAQSQVEEVTLPSTIKKLSDGVFFSCEQLTTVSGLGTFEEIGEFAFSFDTKLDNIDIGSVKTVDDYAFYNDEKLSTVIGMGNIVNIGDYAFAATIIENVILTNAKKIGNYAFYSCCEGSGRNAKGLKTVTLGAVEEFGTDAFAANILLTTVTVGEGTKYIPEAAFMAYATIDSYSSAMVIVQSITTVNLPDTIEEIDDLAFAGAAISTINLKNVKSIGMDAFFYTSSLGNLDMSNVEYIGDGAFYQQMGSSTSSSSAGSNMTEIKLPKAKYIGESAFANNDKVEIIEIGAAEYIGPHAFTNLGTVESVTLPVTLGLTYDYEWYSYDEKGYPEQMQGSSVGEDGVKAGLPRVRHMKAYGDGVFDGTAIGAVNMAGNFKENVLSNGEIVEAIGTENYVSVDGVLYSRRYSYERVTAEEAENYKGTELVTILGKPYARTFIGYQLEQYPSGKAATEYKPIDGTISIANRAFFGAAQLTKVTLPYSVKSIGAGAFLNTNIKEYVFECVQAPELISAYNEDSNSLLITDYYNNFCPMEVYAAYDEMSSTFFADLRQLKEHFKYLFEDSDVYEMLFDELKMADGFGITATVPLNGTGYESPVWVNFFGTVSRTAQNMQDVATYEAVKAIDALPEAATISAYKSGDWNAFLASGIVEQVKAAREAYNKIVDPIQLELATEAQATLAAAELAVREVSKALGHPVEVVSVAPSEYVRNYGYLSDKFDPTGLKLTVTFANGSIITVEGNAVKFSSILVRPIDLGNGVQTNQYYVEGNWTDENGKAWKIDFIVNVRDASGEAPADGNNSLGAGAIAGIAVGVTIAVIEIVAAIVIIALKKKRKAGRKDGPKADTEVEKDNSDGLEAQKSENGPASEVEEQNENNTENAAADETQSNEDAEATTEKQADAEGEQEDHSDDEDDM